MKWDLIVYLKNKPDEDRLRFLSREWDEVVRIAHTHPAEVVDRFVFIGREEE